MHPWSESWLIKTRAFFQLGAIKVYDSCHIAPGASIKRTPGSQIPEYFDNWQDHCSYFFSTFASCKKHHRSSAWERIHPQGGQPEGHWAGSSTAGPGGPGICVTWGRIPLYREPRLYCACLRGSGQAKILLWQTQLHFLSNVPRERAGPWETYGYWALLETPRAHTWVLQILTASC